MTGSAGRYTCRPAGLTSAWGDYDITPHQWRYRILNLKHSVSLIGDPQWPILRCQLPAIQYLETLTRESPGIPLTHIPVQQVSRPPVYVIRVLALLVDGIWRSGEQPYAVMPVQHRLTATLQKELPSQSTAPKAVLNPHRVSA